MLEILSGRLRSARRRPFLRMTNSNLFLKHGNLALIFCRAATGAAGGADYGENRQRLQGGAGHEDALGVRTLVGRVDEIAFRQVLGQIGGHQAFEDFVVFEAQADPQALGAGAGSEGLAGERFGVAELAHEVDAFDLAQIHGDHVAGGVKQFEFALVDELGGRDIAGDGIAVHLADDDFLVGRGHGLGFGLSGFRALAKCGSSWA